MSIVDEAAGYADWLVEREFRGTRDTVEAASHRVAARIGVPHRYLKRLRYEASAMRDVVGSHYRALRAAYEAAVEREARRATQARATRELIEHGLATDPEPAAGLVGGMAPPPSAAPPTQGAQS